MLADFADASFIVDASGVILSAAGRLTTKSPPLHESALVHHTLAATFPLSELDKPAPFDELTAPLADTGSQDRWIGASEWRVNVRKIHLAACPEARWLVTGVRLHGEVPAKSARFGLGTVDPETLRRRVEELERVLDAVPAGVWIARDPACEFITGSRVAHEFLQLPGGKNFSRTAPDEERPDHFRVSHADGREFADEELPMQRATATGGAAAECYDGHPLR